jgi:hypothetical protein
VNTEIILIASIFLLLTLALLPLFIHRTIIAAISGFSWMRKVFLEHYIWVEETSHSGFPEGSINQESHMETYYSYEVVSYNTQTTQINGVTSTTTQPVYGNVPRRRRKYTYEIQRWFKSRELVAEGEEHNAVHWPHYTLDSSTSERIEATKETYLVFFQTAKGKHYRQKLSESDWNALDDTIDYDLRVNLYGKITALPKVRGTMKASAHIMLPNKICTDSETDSSKKGQYP